MADKLTIEMQCAIAFFIAGAAVARADGNMEREEIGEMVDVLQGAAFKSKSQLVRDSARLFVASNDEVMDQYKKVKVSNVDFIKSVSSALKKCKKDDQKRFLWAMFVMMSAVANATGGGWFNDQKVSDDEAQEAMAVFMLLGNNQDLDSLKTWINENGL